MYVDRVTSIFTSVKFILEFKNVIRTYFNYKEPNFQDLALYSIFTIINGVLGGIIFFFHCSANERVREIVVNKVKKLCGKKQETNVEPID